ncbi:MAG: hypothetical protein LBE51_08005 [Acidovorax sp.]|jgi:hypothetical protein|nr:hypothetical protein [Acidovorax sp.]MDR3002864.1 hypothetical protein [Acidovorax sp.]
MPSTSHDHLLAAQQLGQLCQGIALLKQQQLSAADLGSQARASGALLAALPPRYAELLLNVLDRMEASALFTEESCSFSHQEQLNTLDLWAEKAQARLAQQSAT